MEDNQVPGARNEDVRVFKIEVPHHLPYRYGYTFVVKVAADAVRNKEMDDVVSFFDDRGLFEHVLDHNEANVDDISDFPDVIEDWKDMMIDITGNAESFKERYVPAAIAEGFEEQMSETGRYEGCFKDPESGAAIICEKGPDGKILFQSSRSVSLKMETVDAIDIKGKEYMLDTKAKRELAFGHVVSIMSASNEYVTVAWSIKDGKVKPCAPFREVVKAKLDKRDRAALTDSVGNSMKEGRSTKRASPKV